MSLKGKKVFITGSNGGIGKAVTKAFAKAGADIYAHARRKNDMFEQELEEISRENQVQIKPVYFDFMEKESVKREINQFKQNKNKIDILINNAGIAHGKFFQMTPIEEIKNIFDINLFSLMEITQYILPFMKKQKEGVIVNIASISGIELEKGNCAYGVSKAAVIAFTKTLAKETAQMNIRVNAVAPGLTDTKMAKLMEDRAGTQMVRDTAMKRLARPEEIAQTVIFLASEQSSFITGQVLRVDGGM